MQNFIRNQAGNDKIRFLERLWDIIVMVKPENSIKHIAKQLD